MADGPAVTLLAADSAADDALLLAHAANIDRAMSALERGVADGDLTELLLVDTREGRGGISNEALCGELAARHGVATVTQALVNYDFWLVLRSRSTGVLRVLRVYERKTMRDLEQSLHTHHWTEQIARLQEARGDNPQCPLPEFVLLLVGEWTSLRDRQQAVTLTGVCSRLQTHYAHAAVLPVAHDALLPQVLATDMRHARERANGFRFDELPELTQLKRTMLRSRVDSNETWTLFAYAAIHGISVKMAKRIQERYPTLRQAMDAAHESGAAAFTPIEGIGPVIAKRLVACMAPARTNDADGTTTARQQGKKRALATAASSVAAPPSTRKRQSASQRPKDVPMDNEKE